ncbi:MAG: UDP-N-acetylmuramate--L-alanine ligase [Planctomycetota bacterium]
MAAHRYEVSNHGIEKIEGMKFHLIGAGGVGMSGLGQLLLDNSGIVSGSDEIPGTAIDKLLSSGADIKIGHHEDNLKADADAVVISAAITDDNPELQAAYEKGIIVYKYAEMLGMLCGRYDTIAIAGTHGKSTTSGWLVSCLKQLGIDTNFIIGAEISQFGASSGTGQSGYFVAEACEFDRSFLNLRPKISCILNIEQDHLDYFKNEAEITEAFAEFAFGTRANGVLVANGDDFNTAKIIKKLNLKDEKAQGFYGPIKVVTFGLGRSCNYRARRLRLKDGCYRFEVFINGKSFGSTSVCIPGIHNIYNAIAVIAMGTEAGFETKKIMKVLTGFAGMDRRFTCKGCANEITVLDDYAHHPTEIKATLKAVREKHNPRHLWCIFQPHQYSRTRFLLDDFADSFKLANTTIVPDIYFVRDTELSRRLVNAEILVERIQNCGSDALFIESLDGICEHLKNEVMPGDLVITMGAGDIWKVADEYIRWLSENS